MIARTYDTGSTFGVTVSARSVGDFAAHWPCSGFPSRSVFFEFEKRNGDLVDIQARGNWTERADGSAVAALADDAREYGARKLGVASASRKEGTVRP